MKVEVVTDFQNPKMVLPKYAHPGDAAVDLQANLHSVAVISPKQTIAVPTGISAGLLETEVYVNWVLLICPRSGLAAKNNITVLNSPGIIDSGYRGEIKVILYNAGNNIFRVEPGMRIAQMFLIVSQSIHWEEVEQLTKTSRGTGGLGSTGT